MRITTKGRYSLRALLYLSMHADARNVPLTEIATCEDISQGYLESIFSSLRKAGLVMACQGLRGGYRLNCDPQKVTVKEVLMAAEGECSEPRESGAPLRAFINKMVWERADESVEEFLASITLQDVIDCFPDGRSLSDCKESQGD